MTAPSRAKNLVELGAKLGLMFNKETRLKGLALKLRPTDVVISPFGKSGTTWVQQIVHTLRTRGDMDFDDISRVVPWIETSAGLGIDLEAEQKANPRAFKSHLAWDEMPQGGKYIIVIREPKDVLYSTFKFMEGWFLEPGAISVNEFAPVFLGQRAYWHHIMSWWKRREDDDVLLLAFEQMKGDLTGTIRLIARFVGVELDDELLAITQEHASFAFMQKHQDRFDDLMMRELSERVANVPPGSDATKVRAGQVGEHVQHISAEVVSALDEIWQEEVTKVTGFTNYDALVSAL